MRSCFLAIIRTLSIIINFKSYAVKSQAIAVKSQVESQVIAVESEVESQVKKSATQVNNSACLTQIQKSFVQFNSYRWTEIKLYYYGNQRTVKFHKDFTKFRCLCPTFVTYR